MQGQVDMSIRVEQANLLDGYRNIVPIEEGSMIFDQKLLGHVSCWLDKYAFSISLRFKKNKRTPAVSTDPFFFGVQL